MKKLIVVLVSLAVMLSLLTVTTVTYADDFALYCWFDAEYKDGSLADKFGAHMQDYSEPGSGKNGQNGADGQNGANGSDGTGSVIVDGVDKGNNVVINLNLKTFDAGITGLVGMILTSFVVMKRRKNKDE